MGPSCPPPPPPTNSDHFGNAPVFTPSRRDWFQPMLAVITEGFLYRMVITKDGANDFLSKTAPAARALLRRLAC